MFGFNKGPNQHRLGLRTNTDSQKNKLDHRLGLRSGNVKNITNQLGNTRNNIRSIFNSD
ncbi:hypothetical protein GF376_04850 [Candidatus Peregrinibacteria bacterium]|nr:hypothetical protein [Candidatus Peregrinibacteria bacterium]